MKFTTLNINGNGRKFMPYRGSSGLLDDIKNYFAPTSAGVYYDTQKDFFMKAEYFTPEKAVFHKLSLEKAQSEGNLTQAQVNELAQIIDNKTVQPEQIPEGYKAPTQVTTPKYASDIGVPAGEAVIKTVESVNPITAIPQWVSTGIGLKEMPKWLPPVFWGGVVLTALTMTGVTKKVMSSVAKAVKK